MDSLFDILFLVVALIVSVIPAVIKRKKNQKTVEKHQESQTPSADDPWATIIGYLDPSEKETRSQAMKMEDDGAVTAWDDQYGRHEDSKEFNYLEREARSILQRAAIATPPPVPSMHTPRNAQTSNTVREAIDTIGSDGGIEGISDISDESSNNIIDNFNLRTAILYSEVLKPKFED